MRTKVLIHTFLFLLGVYIGLNLSEFPLPSLAFAEQPAPPPPLSQYQKGLESTVLVETQRGIWHGKCTGFIESDYVLVTASHCVDDGAKLTATTTYDEGKFSRYENTALTFTHDGADHVRIKVKYKLLGRQTKMVPMPPPGTPIYVYGHPADLQYQLRLGHVSGQMRWHDGHLYDVIDVDIWHGDSGGAVFDMDGNAVGMVHGYSPAFNPRFHSVWRANLSQPWAFQ